MMEPGTERSIEYPRVSLSDVAEVSWGDTSTTKKSFVGDGFVAYSASGPDGFLPYADYKCDAVVLSAIGARCGRTWFAQGKWSSIKNTIHFRPRDGLADARYLYWITRDEDFFEKRGGAQPFITLKSAREALIPLPPLAEQKRIVAKLDSLTDKSTEARTALARIPDLVERYRDAALESVLGTFVLGFETEAGHALADIAERVFDGPFGSKLKTADYVDNGPRVVRLENIGRLSFNNEKRTHVSDGKFEELSGHELYPDDILFSSFVADAVRVCRFPDLNGERAINKADCFCLRLNTSVANPRFIELLLATPKAYRHFVGLVHGATRPRINSKQLRSLRMDLPSLPAQQEIVDRIETAFAQIDTLAAAATSATEKLGCLDRAILAKAFRGELVPQDPSDEPASILLERIREERAMAPQKKRTRKKA